MKRGTMYEPLISVVVPTYRRPDMLHELLTALEPQLAQVSVDVEVIVVDNCPDASAKSLVDIIASRVPGMRCIHQPLSGVVHARNLGVAQAQGDYVLFIDDDEVPCPTWLDAFVTHAQNNVTLAFGRIVPRFEARPSAGLASILTQLFSRDFDLPDGADISRHMVLLGTGNALFHKARTLPGSNPFDIRFNRSGGEDIWLISGLAARGEPLIWVPDGRVEELVPQERATLAYLKIRRFAQGQQRCLMHARRGGIVSWISVMKWMGIGAVQFVGYTALTAISKFRNDPQAERYNAQIQGGLGKLFWWYNTKQGTYSN